MAMRPDRLRQRGSMLWTIVAVLVVRWLLGVATAYTLGGLVHVLPIIVIISRG